MLKSPRVALLAAVAILAAPVAVRTARADDTAEARQHYTKGKQLFDGGDYRGAMAEFATADKMAPSPLLEFNIALCHERLGEKAEAVRRYRLYLDRVPDAQNRTQVEQKIHQLESEMKADSAPPPAAEPPPSTGPAEAAPPPAAEAAPAPTGDQDLDRVNRIDIGKVRSQREAGSDGGGGSAAAATAPAPEGEANASAPRRDEGGKKSKPIYKQWWFSVVAGVSAIILIDIATSGSDDGDTSRALNFMPSPGARGSDGTGGAVLWRF